MLEQIKGGVDVFLHCIAAQSSSIQTWGNG
jgi:hypothetical protein